MDYPNLTLSEDTALVYVLRHSGCRGRLTAGRVERLSAEQLNVYDERGYLFGYFSGDALRSWCVVNRRVGPLEDWRMVQPEDVDRVLSYGMAQQARCSNPEAKPAPKDPGNGRKQ